MPKFKIAVTWEMAGEFEVEADTLEKAIAEVEDDDDTYAVDKADGEYVDDSFKVIKEYCQTVTPVEVLADFLVNTQEGSVWTFQPNNEHAKNHVVEQIKPEGWQYVVSDRTEFGQHRFAVDAHLGGAIIDLLEENGFVLEVL